MQDGRQLVAKIPYQSQVQKKYAVASEAAVMNYLSPFNSMLPVPKLLDYSATAENPAGVEFLIMEKAKGRPLSSCWQTLSQDLKTRVTMELLTKEDMMTGIIFPASGSLYHKRDLEADIRTVQIDKLGTMEMLINPDEDKGREFSLGADAYPKDSSFVIAPCAEEAWWLGERTAMDIDRGPWINPREAVLAVGQRELAWAREHARPCFHKHCFTMPTEGRFDVMDPKVHIEALEEWLSVAEWAFIPSLKKRWYHMPVLRQPKLQMDQVYVDVKDDKISITSIIDWQQASIKPFWMQSGFLPFFTRDPDWKMPDLEANVAEMPEEDRLFYDMNRRSAEYIINSSVFFSRNQRLCASFMPPSEGFETQRDCLDDVGRPWNRDTIQLKANLMGLYKLWEHPETRCEYQKSDPLDWPATMPFSFSDEEVKESANHFSAQHQAAVEMRKYKEAFGVDDNGYIVDATIPYEEKRKIMQYFKEKLTDKTIPESTRAFAQRRFPFQDYDEFSPSDPPYTDDRQLIPVVDILDNLYCQSTGAKRMQTGGIGIGKGSTFVKDE